VTTDFQASYFALEITKRRSSGSAEKLTAVLADAQVDLHPPQIEVGLGKTIEAGLLCWCRSGTSANAGCS
jgi:adenine-specific DNA-methyltransferase